jgi:hypothetical protein
VTINFDSTQVQRYLHICAARLPVHIDGGRYVMVSLSLNVRDEEPRHQAVFSEVFIIQGAA